MKLRKFPQITARSNRGKPEVSEKEKRLLDERWENYLKNPESALTTDQFDDLLAKKRELLNERLAEHAAHPEDTLTPQQAPSSSRVPAEMIPLRARQRVLRRILRTNPND